MSVTRRRILMPLLFAGIAPRMLHAEPDAEVLPAGLDRVIERALTLLQRQQEAQKGSFKAVGPANAMAALAILAFLASGHVADVGRFGLTVRRAVDFLVGQNLEDGYFGRGEDKMYGHALVTVALAEACGVEIDDASRRRICATLEAAVEVLYEAQDVRKTPVHTGGWRYDRTSVDSDLSVTAWCLLALRSCRGVGLAVPKERVDRAASYVLRCFRADQGGFAYMPGQNPSAAMTGAALSNLYPLGLHDRPEVRAATPFVTARPVAEDTRYWSYAVYYTTLAASHAGGQTWTTVWRRNSERLMPMQRDDGGFTARRPEPAGDDPAGRFYATAMAALTLSIPLRLLPAHQR